MDIIPILLYNKIYFYICFIFVSLTFVNCNSNRLESKKNKQNINNIGILLFIFVMIYMGLRPINGVFGDMAIYNIHFKDLVLGEIPVYTKDPLFELITYCFSKLGSAQLFFFFCCVLYVVPLYIVSKRLFKEYWFYSFLFLVISFSFWAFGTNGIRNGVAGSIFLLALTEKSFVRKLLFIFIAIGIHKSMLIPTIAFLLTLVYKNNKTYFYVWLFSIPFSFVLGSVLESFFFNFGLVEQDSISAYFTEFDEESHGVTMKVGFRWDFIIYSATAVYAAWFFIFKKKFNDAFYNQLICIYLAVNTLWILIVRANYSNRFAYLSWFMIGVITIYPLIKVKFYQDQNKIIGKILLLYFAFTFIMNVILSY